jgi:hypothetical protein
MSWRKPSCEPQKTGDRILIPRFPPNKTSDRISCHRIFRYWNKGGKGILLDLRPEKLGNGYPVTGFIWRKSGNGYPVTGF